MAEFLAVLRADLRNPVPYLSWVTLSVATSIAGPFGSYVMLSFSERLLFWTIFVGIGMVVGVTVRAVVHSVFGLTDFRRGAVLIAAICGVTMSWPMHAFGVSMFPVGHPVFVASLLDVALFIFAISLTIGAFRHSLEPAPQAALPVPQQPEVVVAIPADCPGWPRIVTRLDPEVQGRLVALMVRDHYVDVVTTAGRGSVLIRLADAIAEAAGEPGDQIHRSHWVAWWAVKGIEREAGKTWVRLCPELRLPVSKTHLGKLEDRDPDRMAAE
ncbi:LytTR family DNA-binding domain-containing protein [Gemmobacter serpentinus]|uniref:LytTR family DNA-binding domain-containing protein n=1 Tax=Gemmobacter serpentinus TaxID=2652247 RepID=UPI00124E4B51|nr:LytTR family DNA-binding domain-containing protein [Gemmobacter serpentinus]